MDIKCANEECNNIVPPGPRNRKYCSSECSKIVNNKNIMRRYYERKERLAGKRHICATPGCNTLLSRYNDKEFCAGCIDAKKQKENQSLRDRFGS